MIDQQRKAQQDAVALSQAMAVRGQADAATGQQVWQALARDHAPDALAAMIDTRRARDEADTDLRQKRNQLAAIRESRGPEIDEAVALVKVSRAEERHAEAQEAAQKAEQALTTAVVQVRDRLLLGALRDYNTQLRAVQATYQQRLQEVEAWATAEGARFATFEAEHITPLVAVGAPLPRRLAATNLFDID